MAYKDVDGYSFYYLSAILDSSVFALFTYGWRFFWKIFSDVQRIEKYPL